MSAEGDHITDVSELENLSFYPKWEKQKTEALSYPRAKNKKKLLRAKVCLGWRRL
jgi:hypothetical protein